MHTLLCLISGLETDIIDEAIYYFKANVFFKNYEIKVKTCIIPCNSLYPSSNMTEVFYMYVHLHKWH